MDQREQHDPASTIAEGAASGGFAPGQRISPRYAIIGELGRGSTGRVLNALDGLFDREVALKQNTVAGDAAAAHLMREARITARIEHSNVAPVFDLERLPDGSVYFTMRRIVGIALGEVLRRQARGEPAALPGGQGDIVTIFRKACDAVGRAHEQGLVHRDLKPDNIMLGRHGEVFVVDWG
jgi:serine/threonine protein kinase